MKFGHLFLRATLLFALSFFSELAFAKNLVLMVSSSNNAPQTSATDISDMEGDYERFKDFMSPLEERDISFLHLKVEKLEDLRAELEKLEVGDRVSMIILSGHGSSVKFSLNKMQSYEGSALAEVLAKAVPPEKWADRIAIYVSSCNGASCISVSDNLLEQLFARFVVLLHSQGIEPAEISALAHNFMTTGAGALKVRNYKLIEYLHHKRILNFFERYDRFLIRSYGRTALTLSSMIFGLSVATVLHFLGDNIDSILGYHLVSEVDRARILFGAGTIGTLLSFYLERLRSGVTSLRTAEKNNPNVIRRTGLLKDLFAKVLPAASSCSRLAAD